MVVNKGFSFSNIVGKYVYRESYRSVRSKDDGDYIEALYPGSVKQIYSQNSFEEGSIAYEFASIDTSDMNAIVAFCSKYGLLYSDRLERNRKNDYMFSKTYKSLFSEENPDYKPDRLHVSTFVREILTMRHFLALKSALDSEDVVETVNNISRILLSFSERTHIPADTETELFNNQFYSFIRRRYRFGVDIVKEYKTAELNFVEVDIHESLRSFLNELEDYRNASDSIKRFFYGSANKYDDIYHCTWQAFCELFSKLLKKTTIKSDGEGRQIHFEPPITEELLNEAEITFESVRIAGNACVSDIMNSQTAQITPELRYENGKLTADWHITSLLEAMYMELQVTFSPNTQIRKCANPTCNFFFDVGVGNTKKIYCSQRCALLMAKRKQRERDKLKK